MAGMINETMNRVLLKNLLPYDLTRNLKELAMFNVNYKLAIIMTLAIQAFRMGAEPFFFKESKEKNSRKTYAVIMDFFIIACCIIMVLTSINREIIGSINHARYLEGVKILPLILLANLFLGIYYNASIWFKLTDNTRKGAWISIMGAVITIGFNWLLIPIMGYEGSALATLLCYSSMALVSLFWGQRVFPIPYDFKYNFLWIAMSTAYTYVVFDLFRGSVLALIMSSIVFLAIAAYFCLLRWRFSKTYLTQDA
jgi:O-antigen/teichoic acid export membrane protein